MKSEFKSMIVCVALGLAALTAQADNPPASVTPPSQSGALGEAGEPRASTSPESPTPGAPAASSPNPMAEQPAARPGASRTSSGAAAGGTTRSKAAGKPANDRLDLGTATVTGDREQPKVMYIVPWKRSDIGDLSGKPMNSLLDEALAPVDRDEFKRQVVYYQAVRADAPQNGASKAPAQQGEK